MSAHLIDIHDIPSLPEGTVIWNEYVLFNIRYSYNRKTVIETDSNGQPVISEHGLLPILICAHDRYAYEYGTGYISNKFANNEQIVEAPERFWSEKPDPDQIKDLTWAMP